MVTGPAAVPLDGHDDTFRCTTCGAAFVSGAGWATCPDCPAEIDGSIADPDEMLHLILADARPLARGDGPAADLARRVLALHEVLSLRGVLPLPWAINLTEPRRGIEDIHLPGDSPC